MSKFDKDALNPGAKIKTKGWDLTNGYAPSSAQASDGERPPSQLTAKQRTAWFKSLPSFDSLDNLKAVVEAEKREDVVFDLAKSSMSDDGSIILPDGKKLALERPAFIQMMRKLKCKVDGATKYLAACPVELRIQDVNHWIKALEGVETKVMCRTRNGRDDFRRGFAFTGINYPRHDADIIAVQSQNLLSALKIEGTSGRAKPRVRWSYNGYRATIQVLWELNKERRVGDLNTVGLMIRSNDVGKGSLFVKAYAMKLVCLNGMQARLGDATLARRPHIGSVETMMAKLNEAVTNGVEAIPGFLKAWEKARETEIKTDVTELFTKLVKSKKIHIPGFHTPTARKEVVTRLVESHAMWNPEGTTTKASVVDAVTYAAHAYDWKANSPGAKWAKTEEIEAQAGQLVYVNLAA